jgi:hypothetical protein
MSEKQAVGRSKKGLRERWKGWHGGSAQPGRLHLFSQDQSSQSSRALSPVPSKGTADNASAVAGVSSSTPKIRPGADSQLVARIDATILAVNLDDGLDQKSDDDQNIEVDDNEDAELGAAADGSQDQENQNTGPEMIEDDTTSAQEDNMWSIAETQLRQDQEKNKLLDAYYDILKSKLKDLDSSDTFERQKQISAFIESESNTFQDTRRLGKSASVLKKAADCIVKAEKVISAATQPFLPASVVCAGVMLVLSVSSLLLLYALDADAQIALYSSWESAGHSI